MLRPAVQTVNYCMHNLVSPFISCWKHEAKVQKKQICRDDVNLAQMFNLGNCNIQYNTQNNLHPPPQKFCSCVQTTSVNWDSFFFCLDPCLLYFWVQSQTNSLGLTAQIKGLILRSSCCFFPFLQKPQGSSFIVFSVLSSLKITHKANN